MKKWIDPLWLQGEVDPLRYFPRSVSSSLHAQPQSWPTLASLALLFLLILLISFLLGFFKGTSADQDRRFSDKELKLLKSIKFPPQFDTKVFPFTFSSISL